MVTADLKVVHHHDLKLIRDVGNWIEAHIKVAEKWDGRMPLVGKEGDPEDWKARARRAEAQASAERMIALSARLYRDARIEQLIRQREQIEEEVESCGSRGTGPVLQPTRTAPRRADAPLVKAPLRTHRRLRAAAPSGDRSRRGARGPRGLGGAASPSPYRPA